ncbi:MAG: RHS repeat-associated core domain-containing protein [Nitrospirota bacterium]
MHWTLQRRATDVRLTLAILTVSLFVTVSLGSVASAQTATDFFLHGTGSNANPATLFLNTTAPTSGTAKYKDSASVNFNGGNPWVEVGTWPANPVPTAGTLSALAPVHVWLGLKNSDDQGTNYDVRAEISRNGSLVVAGQTLCITGITRNAANALETTVAFGSFDPQTFNGTSDGLSLKILTRIGTNPDGTKCAGHNNAVGLRLYFDATSRAATFGATLGAPNPVPTALVPDPLPITVGATGTLTATLSPTPDTPGSLVVGSSAPAVATVPASVAFVAGQATVSVPVTAVSPGTSLITVSLNGGSITSTAQVTPAPPTVTSLGPDTLSITQGGSGTLTVTISSAQTTDTSVALTSTDPGVAFVASSVTVLSGQVDATIAVSANSPGTAQITATLNSTNAVSTITVTPAPPTVVSLLPATSSVTLGATTAVTVTISGAQSTDTIIAISASPNGIISVPATVTVLAGQTTADIPVGTVSLGTASVQAGLNGSSSQAAVQVVPPAPTLVSLVPAELSIEVGATSSFTVALNAAQLSNTVITLNVDHPERLLAPASVTVPAGSIDASFTVTGQAIGDAVITASLNGGTQSATIHVTPIPPAVVSLQPSTLSIQQDANGTFTLTINVAQPADTSIPIANTAPAVLQAPSSVTVPAGATSVDFAVMGLSPGSATVTASINATSVSATVQVTPLPTIVTGLTPATLSLPKGSPGVLHVTVSPVSPDPQTVTLTSSNPSVAQVPTTVTVPAGSVGADFPVFTLVEGLATITATLGAGSASSQVTVTAPELTTITVSPDAPSVYIGETQAFSATGTYTDGTTQNLTASATWSSSDAAVAAIDTAGVASALTAGTTTITAASGAISDSTLLTVLVPPSPTITDFTPTSGPVGTVVTITGENFGPTATVFFNGVQATSTNAASMMAATVPLGATTGPITMTTAGGSATSATNFSVTNPLIASLSPTNGPQGIAVTITGQNFDPFAANNQVWFNGTQAIITSATSTTIQTTVPIDATTGPVSVTTSVGTATSPEPFTVVPRADFTLQAVPATATVLQGGAVVYVISAESVGDFTNLITLGVSGLPTGVTAVYEASTLAAGNRTTLRVAASGTTPTGPTSFSVTGSALMDTGPSTQTIQLTLDVQVGGNTAVAGQFVTVDGEPLSGVHVRLGTAQTNTDAAGNFLLTDVPSGTQQLMIDANAARPGYPMYAADVTLTANQTTVLPPFQITPPPPPERFVPISNATATQVVTDSRFPGFSLTLPAGATITGWDGNVKTQIALERLSPDRLPVLPPPGPTRSLYQIFFGTPMGGVPSAPLPVSGPNDLDLDPGDKAQLWYYDASPMGGTAGWRLAGLGTVSADGSRIVSDPGVGIQRFCGVCGLTCWLANQAKQLNLNLLGPSGADPVDLRLGQMIVQKTDLVLPGRVPVQLSRTYNPFDPFATIGGFQAPLGQGWALSVDVILMPTNSADLMRLILPGNARLDLVRQADGTFMNTSHPFLAGAVLSVVAGGDHQLRFKDGNTWRFRSLFLGVEFLVEMADRYQNRITIERQSGGGITRIVDAAGRAFEFTFTASRLTQIQDPMGRTVSYTYNAANRLQSVTDPAGGVTQYTYDTAGRMLTITDARNIQFIQNVYGPSGRVLRQIQANGGEWRIRYRLSGGDVQGPGCPGSPSCAAVEDSWDSLQAGYTVTGGFVVAATVVDPEGHETTHRVSNSGFTTDVIDALGQPMVTTYNPNNQVETTTDSLGRTTSFSIDTTGDLLSTTDAAGNITTYTYEPTYHQISQVTDALGHVTTFAYDISGNLISRTDPDGQVTSFTYNAFGQPLTVTDPLGNTTSFEYDDAGNLSASVDPLGNRTARLYDKVSRLVALQDPQGFTTTYQYDALNRVTTITDAAGGTTGFTYDPNGNLLSITDAKNQTTAYTYDAQDKIASRTDALNRGEGYVYDLNSNLTQFTDRKGQVSTFTYDGLNRRIQADHADSSQTTWTYDAVGRLVQANDTTSGPIDLAYDGVDRLSQVVTPQGVVTYAYDAVDRRTAMSVNGQSAVSYIYDTADRLTGVAQDTQTVALGYDAAGRRTSLTYPNGTNTAYTYDPADRVTRILHQGPVSTIEDLTYEYDSAGRRIAGGRIAVQSALPTPVQAAYDDANEQIQFNSAAPNLAYDANGNLTSHVDASGTTTYTWDARNRLIAISGPSVSASFTYDAFGRRISKVINGNATDYQYDGGDIVAEIDGGAVAAGYLRSLNTDEPFQRRSTQSEFYHADALGSVLGLTDGAGAETAQYSYASFGRTTSTGTTTNPFQYTGREHDGTGLYYYRARYYAPALQRFLSEDPIEFAGGDPNLYAYVFNSPTNYTDPTGEFVQVLLGCAGGAFASGAIDVLSGRKIDYGGLALGCAEGAIGVGALRAIKAIKALRAAKGAKPFSPEAALTKNAPRQVTPGTKTLEHTKLNPETGQLERSTVHYDQYGRQVGRTDYTTHGRPNAHTDPHHHTTEYGPGYAPGGKESRAIPGPYQ